MSSKIKNPCMLSQAAIYQYTCLSVRPSHVISSQPTKLLSDNKKVDSPQEWRSDDG